MSHPCLRRIVLLTMALLAGCFSWRKSPADPGTLLADKRPPNHVRLHLAQGGRKEMWHPRIVDDSIIGTVGNNAKSAHVAVTLADVTRVEVNRFNTGKTIAVVAGVGVATLLVAAVAVASSDYGLGGGGGGGDGGYASCPQVYSWDGAEWRLDSGTFGGAFMEPLELTDYDNLDYPVPVRGTIWLKVGNELDETEHVDALTLLAVDHPVGRTIVPARDGRVLSLGTLESPVTATDGAGRDARAAVRQADDWSWESTLRTRDLADSTAIRDRLEVAFVRPAGARHATLVLDGHNTAWASLMLKEFIAAHGNQTREWYHELASAPQAAKQMAGALAREGFLSARVQTDNRWIPQGVFWEAGPEVAKRQVLPLDLTRVDGDTVRIRLESIPSFWLVDRLSIAWGEPETVTPTALSLIDAEDQQGQDVAQELALQDGKRLTLETDDWAELRFRDAPGPVPGLKRSYLLRSTGWYRVHTPEAGPVDSAMLAEVGGGPGGVSRAAVRRLNGALRWLTPATAGGAP